MKLLGESLGTNAAQQTQIYAGHIQRTANELARASWSVFGHVAVGIASGTDLYTLPYTAQEVRFVHVNDGSGNIRQLDFITPTEAEMLFLNYHATDTAAYSGIPEYYLIESLANIKLFPVPNYTQSYGLIVSAYLGIEQWWAQTTACPLPETYDDTLINGICYRRCREMVMVNKDYAEVLPLYSKPYMDALVAIRLEAEQAALNRRGGVPPATGSAGATFGGSWNFWA